MRPGRTYKVGIEVEVSVAYVRPSGEQPCSIPSPSTDVPLTPAQVHDLICAYLHEENGISEGFLNELLHETNGMTGDQVRAMWFDAIERGNKIANAYLSGRRSREAGNTPGSPG